MTNDEFEKMLFKRLALIRSTLSKKSKEYSSKEDRLHNFNRAADMLCEAREKSLVGMLSKHLVSILDIVDNIQDSGKFPTVEMVEEKIGDAINYLILLEAMLKEDIELNPNARLHNQ